MVIKELSADIEVPSENCLYKPAFSGKRTKFGMTFGHSYLYKDPDITVFQDKIKFLMNFDLNDIPMHINTYGMMFHFKFYIRRDRFWEKDVTNMIKATEDAIIKIINPSGFDDKHTVTVIEEKFESAEGQDDKLFVNIGFITEDDLETKSRTDMLIELVTHNRKSYE